MPRRWWLALVCACALRAETVLVVPFFNHSNSANLDWIGESIAESMQDSLASEGLLVLGRDDRLEAYRRLSLRPGAELTHASLIKIGMSLDAAKVVYGSFELLPALDSNAAGGTASRGQLRMVARILDLKRLRQGAEMRELGPLEDLAELQAHLGWQALQQLAPGSAPAEQDFKRAERPVRIDAVENYIRGLLAATPEDRMRFFNQAVRLEEHYSPACFQLGKLYWERKEYKLAGGWFSRVARSDARYHEAQFFGGMCSYWSGDFAAAEAAFQRVSEAVPLNEVFNDLGAAEARLDKLSAAAVNFQKAVDGDGSDPDYQFNLGYANWRAGRLEVAADCFRAVLDRNPGDTEATLMLGRSLKGDSPRPGDTRFADRVRLKQDYEEDAYRQLQAELKK